MINVQIKKDIQRESKELTLQYVFIAQMSFFMSSAPKTLDVFVLQEEDKMRMESANFVKTPFVIHVIQ